MLSLPNRVLDLLLPPLCVNCQEPVAAHQALCAPCWRTMNFIAAPVCAVCGASFDIPVDDGTVCSECLGSPPAFARARSAMAYDEASKRLVLSFKHGDRLHGVPAMALWMKQAGAALLTDAQVLVPVPLHWWRLFGRRYNQASLLALALGRETGKQVCVDALCRTRRTPSQGAMNRADRRKNVAGAIAVSLRRAGAVKGRRVLLIDDVLTTGATVDECARALLKVGALDVDVLTLMRARAVVR